MAFGHGSVKARLGRSRAAALLFPSSWSLNLLIRRNSFTIYGFSPEMLPPFALARQQVGSGRAWGRISVDQPLQIAHLYFAGSSRLGSAAELPSLDSQRKRIYRTNRLDAALARKASDSPASQAEALLSSTWREGAKGALSQLLARMLRMLQLLEQEHSSCEVTASFARLFPAAPQRSLRNDKQSLRLCAAASPLLFRHGGDPKGSPPCRT